MSESHISLNPITEQVAKAMSRYKLPIRGDASCTHSISHTDARLLAEAAIASMEPGVTHYVQVGRFLLSHGKSHPGKVYIEVANDGEGGEFNQSDLEPVLKEFYDKHF